MVDVVKQDVSQDLSSELKEFFLFEIDVDYYAIELPDLDQVMKIPPITPVPNAPRAIVGIFHLRGGVVVVLDLIRRMNMPKSRPLTANYLFVAHHGKNQFGILVDKPRTIVRVRSDHILPLDPLTAAHVPPQYANGMFMFDDVTRDNRKERSFMIEPKTSESKEEQPVAPLTRPVVWLNVKTLLDQEDLLGVFAPGTEGIKS